MGIYINMEMPKEIEPALVIDFCEGLNGERYARFYNYRYRGLTDWHEVYEIHEPHGKLIDADALPISTAVPLDGKPYQYVHIDNIKAAPFIIPASKEGET